MNPVRLVAVGLLGVGLGFPAGGSAIAQEGTPLSISLATGGVAGVYFPLGGAMAEAWSAEVADLTVTAESTGASVVNVRLIEGREAELALVQNDIASYAYNAEEMFADDAPLQQNLGLAMLYPEVIQIVTLQGSGIATVDDLAGKRVAVGAPGSGTEANARQILEAHGITYDALSEQFLPFGEAVEALRDGRIDAAFLTAGIPTAAVIDLGATHDVVIVSIAPEKAEEIVARWPFYSAFTIPAGTYTGIADDISTVTVQAMLVASAELDPQAVEQMLEVLYREETLTRLCDTHVRGCDVTLDTALEAMPIPLHPGAERFYNRQQ
jgi:TRAP transporter TAXI family solute receptor